MVQIYIYIYSIARIHAELQSVQHTLYNSTVIKSSDKIINHTYLYTSFIKVILVAAAIPILMFFGMVTVLGSPDLCVKGLGPIELPSPCPADFSVPSAACTDDCLQSICNTFTDANITDCIFQQCMKEGFTNIPNTCGATALVTMKGILGLISILVAFFIL